MALPHKNNRSMALPHKNKEIEVVKIEKLLNG
jgi:hypothetical protein